jgi:NADPH:quinone reductase-like Zn-dependent oxidoreductase
LGEGKIKPVIDERFAMLETVKANALLEIGRVTGNLILVTPELL